MPTKYNLNRKNISMLNEDHAKLEALKDKMKFKSLTETISIMVDIIRQIQLEKEFVCKDCGKKIPLSQDSNPDRLGLVHKHIEDTKCFGCIKTSYRVKKDTNGITTANDNTSGQTDTKDKVTKSWMTPRGLVETIGDFDYINGKKVRTYIGSDPQQPMLDEDYEDIP